MAGALPFTGVRRDAFAKPKPLLMTASFRLAASGSSVTAGPESEASVVKAKRPASSISPG